jgi:hypothetical protein
VTLYHYTCRHGRDAILRAGMVVPRFQPLLGVDLAWFTDLPTPDRDGLGLTSYTLACDRTAWRVPVQHAGAVAWTTYRRALLRADVTPLRRSLLRRGVERLETEPGAMPRHWWVSTEDTPTRGAILSTLYGEHGPGVVIPPEATA